MKHLAKRLLALLLMLAMIFSLLPAMAFAVEDEMPQVDYITAEDDALVEADVLSDIDSYFTLSAKRDGELTLADYVAASKDLKSLVQESDTYVEGSLVERGDGFFWQTTAGITCGYFPKDRYEADQRVATKAVNTSSLATWSYTNATSKDVCLVAPMYSEDSTFTNQYVNEALSIAEALGGTAYGLIDSAATVTTIGQALEKCGVVIFDSHGNTDWGYFEGGSDGTGEADCVTEANTSYLCLSSGTGMTTADCAYVTGNFGTYPHAYKDSYGNYVADGTAFANHMNGNAPGSLLWMAICLGMSTEGFCTPLRNKGVSVVYGYSQSVTFYGDYLYEEYFWNKMIAGEAVATAAAYMKTTAGCKWDPYYSSYSESSARRAYAAFPVVVSDQDTYPGQRSSSSNGACSVQTVKSTYTLFNNYTISASTNNSNSGTVSVSGNVITASPKDGYYAKSYTVLSGTATVTQNGNIFTVDASSDCSIRINFAAKSPVTVSFSGVSGVSSLTGYAGEEMSLPTVAAPEGFTFLGWTTAAVNEAVTEKPEYFTVYTPTASITLYPLYSYAVAGGGSTEYVLTDIGEISATDSVVVTMTYTDGTVYALYNANGTTKAPTGTIITVNGDKLAISPDSTILWNIGSNSSGYIFYPEGTTDIWLYCTGTNNGVRVGTNTANTFVIDSSSGYLKHTGTGRYVGVYRTNPDWRCYTNTTGNTADQALGFYVKGQGGTTYYTSVTGSTCEHTNTTTATVEPTCTAAGSTTVTCDDCGAVISTTTIDALGHSYVDGTCTNCGEAEPAATDYSGRYYIAGIRSADTNYQYLLGAMDGSRYDIEDSGLTTLPTEITDPTANKIFVIEKNADGTYSIYAEGITDEYKYLGWTSGNSGEFVTADSALSLSIDALESGLYNIYFYSEGDAQNRYLSLNATATLTYAAWYRSGQTKDLALIPVTGEAPEHVHVPTYFAGQAATCEGEGVVDYWYCADDACPNYGICYSDEALTVVIAAEDLTIDALGHNMVAGTVHAPTCTEEGYTEYACTNGCGTTDIGDIIDALGHDMTYTDNEDGTHTYGCAHDCDIEDVIEDHVYVDGICPCGAEEVTVPSEPTEVTIKISHTVSFDSDLQMNYRIKLDNILAAIPNYVTDGAYLVVEKDRYPMGGGAKTVETVTLYPDLTTDSTRMLFSLPGIQSVEMGSELRAVLHIFDAEGNEYYTPVDAYSILAYAELCFDTYTPSKDGLLFTMLIDCLNYGAAAQVNFDRRADELVNAGMDAYQQYATTQLSAELTDTRTYVDNERSITAVTAMGFSVNFADKTEINAKLTIASGYTKADITSVKVLNEAGDAVDTLTQFTDLDDGRIQVTFTGVKSANMRDMYYFVAYVGDQVASQNVGYSIEAYAKSNINSSDAGLAALVRNCIYYGDAAKTYFDSLLGKTQSRIIQ